MPNAVVDLTLAPKYAAMTLEHETEWFWKAHSMRPTSLITLSCALFLIALAAPADARGGGGYNRGNVGDEHLAGGRRHGNNAYMKAASEERDKLLNTKLKSICRGC